MYIASHMQLYTLCSHACMGYIRIYIYILIPIHMRLQASIAQCNIVDIECMQNYNLYSSYITYICMHWLKDLTLII